MSPISQPLEDYYAAHDDTFLDGLKEFLRIPSVSTLPEHRADIGRAAAFVTGDLERMGMHDVRLIEGEGHPIVAAEWLRAPGKPTLVLYGHYDVQPPDPLNEWHSPPFEPEARGDDLFARGAADDKGQTYLLLKAVEGFLQTTGKLPLNVKFLIEGEEESGGEIIDAYLREQGQALGAEAALLCDTEMFAPELPTLCVGLRGAIYTEIEVWGPRTDPHSGVVTVARHPTPCRPSPRSSRSSKAPTGRCSSRASTTTSKRPPPPRARLGAACRLTKTPTSRTRLAQPRWPASRATACLSGPGRGPRSMCTASVAASPVRVQKPSSPHGPWRRSACGWRRE